MRQGFKVQNLKSNLKSQRRFIRLQRQAHGKQLPRGCQEWQTFPTRFIFLLSDRISQYIRLCEERRAKNLWHPEHKVDIYYMLFRRYFFTQTVLYFLHNFNRKTRNCEENQFPWINRDISMKYLRRNL